MFIGCIVKVTMRKQQKFVHSRMSGASVTPLILVVVAVPWEIKRLNVIDNSLLQKYYSKNNEEEPVFARTLVQYSNDLHIHYNETDLKNKTKKKRVPIVTADFPFRNVFIPEKEESIPCLVIATKYIELLASFHSNIFPDFFFFINREK